MSEVYQPALLRHQIRALYFLKLETGKPMTWHARRAVEMYLERFPDIRFDEEAIRGSQPRYALSPEGGQRGEEKAADR